MMMIGIMMGTIVLLADIGVRHLFWGSRYRGRSRTSSSSGGGQAQIIILVIAIVLMILAPIIAQLIYFAVSRKREYLADACSAQYTRYPEGLAGTLEKISGTPLKLKSATRATAPMYIVNPLAVTKMGLKNVSSTHPPISERVKILRSMAGGAGVASYDTAFKKVTGKAVGVVPFSAIEKAAKPEVKSPIFDARTHIDRVRETTNVLWSLNQYIFLACACGTKLKIPPEYKGQHISCPHCNRQLTCWPVTELTNKLDNSQTGKLVNCFS